MTFTGMTSEVHQHIHEKWVGNDAAHPFNRQVTARAANLIMAPVDAIAGVGDTVIGVLAGVGTIVSLGENTKIFRTASHHLSRCTGLIVRPYRDLLHCVNPRAVFSWKPTYGEAADARKFGKGRPLVYCDGDGLLTGHVKDAFYGIGRWCRNHENVVIKHVVSRLSSLLSIAASAVCRAVDFVFGVIAAVLSFVALGKSETLNNTAHRGLQVTGIVGDVIFGITRIINPWAGYSVVNHP